MSSSFKQQLTVVATTLSLGLVVLSSAASADVGWIVQSSSQLGGSASLTLPAVDLSDPSNANPDPSSPFYVPPIIITSQPETDPGTDGDPALGKNAVNSMISHGTGYFTTVGNNFTSVMDFGPAPATPTNANLTIMPTIVGNFLPNTTDAGSNGYDANGNPTFNFGTPSPVESAAALITQSPLSGPNAYTGLDFSQASRDNGRISVFGLQSLPFSPAPVPVTNGTFDGGLTHFLGTAGVSLNVTLAANYLSTDGVALVLTPTAIGINDISNDLQGAQALGTITRSGGLQPNTGSTYTLTQPFATTIDLGGGLTVLLSINAIANANLVAGDTNFDGIVNIQDITQIASNWLKTDSTHLGAGDANGDGVVNIQDITLAASHWLQSPPPLVPGGGGGSVSAVPEPSSLLLLGFGAVSMLVMVRRRARR